MNDVPPYVTPCCSVNELKDHERVKVIYAKFTTYGQGTRVTHERCKACGQVWEMEYQQDIAAGSSVELRKVGAK